MQRCYNTDIVNTPSPGTVRGPVTTLSGLQTAYAAAACGDIIQITAGSSITGPWSPAGKVCDNAHYITVESTGISNGNFPAQGTRTTPCWSNVGVLPNRPVYSCATPAQLTAKIIAPNSSSSVILNGTDHIRFIGIEFTRITTPHSFIFMLVDFRTSGATQPNHIIFDRCWFHGVNADGQFPQVSATDTSTVRAIYLAQANYVGMIDSYFSDFYVNGSVSTTGQTDAQAITGGIGTVANTNWGAYKIVNNHIEGSTEGIIFGGGPGPALTPTGCTIFVNCNLDVPTDAEVRRNNFFKPLSWISPSGATSGWPVVKNGFEMKSCARCLFEGNTIYNVWPEAQPGYVFSIAPKNQPNSGANPVGQDLTAGTFDLVYRYNYGYNVAYGIGLYSSQDTGCTSCQSQGANRISIHDNVVDNLNVLPQYTGGGDAQEYTANIGSPLNNISVRHNTITLAKRGFVIFGAGATGLLNTWDWRDNIMPNGGNGTPGSGGFLNIGGPGGCQDSLSGALNLLNACVTAYQFNHDVIMGGTSTGWPTGNFFPAPAAVGFTNFNNGNGGNYQLLSTSPYHNAASDGTDIGANIGLVGQYTAGVVGGTPTNPPPSSWQIVSTPAGATQIRGLAIDGSNRWFLVDRISGVWLSTNQGTSWVQKNTGLINTAGWIITYDANHSQVIVGLQVSGGTVHFYRTSNQGTTWTAIPISAPLSSVPSYTDSVFTPGGRSLIGGHYQTAVTGGTGMFYSTDGGATTINSTKTGTSDATLGGGAWGLYYNPVKGDLWEGTEQYCMYRSTDGGATFHHVSPPDSNLDATDNMRCGNATGISSDISGNVLMGGQGNIWKSSGACTFWTSPGVTDCTWTSVWTAPGSAAIRQIWRDPFGMIYFGHRADPAQPGSVYRSADQGVTWQPFNTGLPNSLEGWQFQYNSFDGHIYATFENAANAGFIYRY